ncbi:MAG: aminoglycoside phosphotransferase family protein [Armatimonas sp.]
MYEAATQFLPQGASLSSIEPFGNGNINKTYLAAHSEGSFILQRINEKVFKKPALVMQNLVAFAQHVEERLKATADKGRRGWEVPLVVPTVSGADHWVDGEGGYWRGLTFIEDVETFDTIRDLRHAREVGEALGMFHCLISDMPAERLADTLPGFHITPGYLAQYDEALGTTTAEDTENVLWCKAFVEAHRAEVAVLEEAGLPLRPIHGDPKVNNILMDLTMGHAVSIVDLDTVKPGLVHYDIGDCLRSGCNRLGEETKDWKSVTFDLDLCQELLRGYLSEATFLTDAEREHLFNAVRLIPFELGLRFFTDHLNGNVYFTASHATHNLERALVQFQLAASVEAQEAAIRQIINEAV